MAEEDQEQEEVVESKGGSKKLIIMIVGGVLALLIIIGATLFFTGFFDAKEPAASDDPAAEQTEESDDGEESDEVAEGGETAYLALTPAFMVNFQGPGIKVMKVSISVMAKSEASLDAIKLHDPVIRNNILLLLSAENPDALKTAEGKQKLQGSILEEINKVLKERKVKTLPEAVFFTDLVMQ
jgi:flagellar FliL protein